MHRVISGDEGDCGGETGELMADEEGLMGAISSVVVDIVHNSALNGVYRSERTQRRAYFDGKRSIGCVLKGKAEAVSGAQWDHFTLLTAG